MFGKSAVGVFVANAVLDPQIVLLIAVLRLASAFRGAGYSVTLQSKSENNSVSTRGKTSTLNDCQAGSMMAVVAVVSMSR